MQPAKSPWDRTAEPEAAGLRWLGLRPGQDMLRTYRASGVWRNEGPLADLRKWREETPEATAIVAYRNGADLRRLTYREFSEQVERFAGALSALGVGPGDVVAVQLPNWWQVSALLLACARVEAVFTPVMMTIGPRELERVLKRLGAVVCVTADRWNDADYARRVAEMAPDFPSCGTGWCSPTGKLRRARCTSATISS